jgi:RsiW-degrading membrane proteinase PrsW (M82 family)
MNAFAIGFAGWLAGAAIWFWWVRRYDRFEPEPIRHLLVVGVLGGLVSGLVAGIGNEAVAVALGIEGGVAGVSGGQGLSAPVALVLATFVGFNEEILKALAAVLLTRRFGDLDEPVDAPLYAMMTALGFAVFENVHYAAQHGAGVLLPRYLLATPLHVILALVWGAAWAKGRFLVPRRPLWLVMAPATCLASLLHAAWDYVMFIRSAPGVLVAVVTLVTLAAWAHGSKRTMAMESPYVTQGSCPQCGGVSDVLARFCRHCGRSLFGRYYVQCGGCRGRMPTHAAFCPICGVARANT